MSKRTQNNSKKMRLSDIARLAGFSTATVSMALRGDEGVKTATRRKILKLAEEHNYRTNLQAQSLRLQKTRRIAMILPELENMFLIDKLREAREVFWDEGYEVAFSCTNWNPEAEKKICDYFLAQQVDALIVFQISGESVEHLEAFCNEGKPVCVIGGPFPRSFKNFPGLILIRPDLEGGMSQAVRLLLHLGHRRFATIGITPDLKLRHQGINRALSEAGLDAEQVVEIPANGPHLRQGREAMNMFLKDNSRKSLPTALLAVNDNVAIGATAVLKEHGIMVPEDVSVVGCDNIEFAAYVTPGLTTISQSAGRLGRLAATMVLEQLRTGSRESRYIQEPTELVVRESTGPVTAGDLNP